MTRVSTNLVAILANASFFLLHVVYSEKIGIVAVDTNNNVRKRNNNQHDINDNNKSDENLIFAADTTKNEQQKSEKYKDTSSTTTDTSRRLDDPLQGFGSKPESWRYPLRVCQGDCDSDNDCANGLYCFQKERNEPVPGCYENSQGDFGAKTDYCIRINAGNSGNNGGNDGGGGGGVDSSSSSSSSSSSTSTTTVTINGNEGMTEPPSTLSSFFPFLPFLDCFSSKTVVDVMNRGSNIRMEEINVGDKVLTSTGNYEVVYAIDHRDLTKNANFVQVLHENQLQHPLELTERHMLFLEGMTNPVPAKNIRIGDRVQTLTGPSTVIKITRINRNGVFSPLTYSGTIVASGIIASTYSAYLGDEKMEKISNQNFFDMALKPYRYICTNFGIPFGSASKQTTQEMLAISQLGAKIYEYWLQIENKTLRSMCLSLCIMIVSLTSLIFSPFVVVAVITTIGWFRIIDPKRGITRIS